jgi:succinyl-diaminopimelate desuccinylase
MKTNFSRISGLIDGYEKNMAEILSKMIEIKSLAPEAGGEGEAKRTDFLQSLLEKWGFSTDRYDYLDTTKTKRSNLVVKFGKQKKTLWIITHTDTVFEGKLSLWKTNPFKGKIVGNRVYGRGASDNGQDVIASIFALKSLKDANAKMKYNMGLVLAADEETGSYYGVRKLLNEKIFRKDDLFLVPDIGTPTGNEIEISEKNILWLRIVVKGKQVHASLPQLGVNAYRYSIRFLAYLDDYLHKKYNHNDPLFITPSTFEMTKHEKNVDSINIIPGMEVSYIDCRILPQYSLDVVLKDMKRIAKMPQFRKAKIKVDIFDRENAPATSEKSEIVAMLKTALKDLRGIKAKCVGTGGGTVAKAFRKKGMEIVAWDTEDEIAHQPNEYTEIKYMVGDAKVFAYLCLS